MRSTGNVIKLATSKIYFDKHDTSGRQCNKEKEEEVEWQITFSETKRELEVR